MLITQTQARRARFLFLFYVQNKFFWAQQNFGGHQKILGRARHPNARGYGPAQTSCQI